MSVCDAVGSFIFLESSVDIALSSIEYHHNRHVNLQSQQANSDDFSRSWLEHSWRDMSHPPPSGTVGIKQSRCCFSRRVQSMSGSSQ